jgi:hypothetical protein
MTNSEYFKQHHYTVVKDLIPKEICNVATKYALLKMETEFNPEDTATGQIPGTHSIYGDTLMETLMFFMLPHMEKHTGLELCPTYTYYRVYKSGDELLRHKDRPSCEISTTICLGFKYDDPAYRWPILVDEKSISVSAERGFISAGNPGTPVAMEAGDVVIYRGCDIEHWREPFTAEEGSYHVQAFLHYIDKNGPYYPEYAFDRRKGIGHIKDTHK